MTDPAHPSPPPNVDALVPGGPDAARVADRLTDVAAALAAIRAELGQIDGTVRSMGSVVEAVANATRDAKVQAGEQQERLDQLSATLEAHAGGLQALREVVREGHAAAVGRDDQIDQLRLAVEAQPGAVAEVLGQALAARQDSVLEVVRDTVRFESSATTTSLRAMEAVVDAVAQAVRDTDDARRQEQLAHVAEVKALLAEVLGAATEASREDARQLRGTVATRHDELTEWVQAELARASSVTIDGQRALADELRAALRAGQAALGESLRESVGEATAVSAASARADAEVVQGLLAAQQEMVIAHQTDVAEVLRTGFAAAAAATADAEREESMLRRAESDDLRAALLGQHAATAGVVREVLAEVAVTDREARHEDTLDLRRELLDNQAALAGAVRELLDGAAAAETRRRVESFDRLRVVLAEQQTAEVDRLARSIEDAIGAATDADLAARRQDVTALREEVATMLGAVQSTVVERLAKASSDETATLRATMATGFDRVSASFGSGMLQSIQATLREDAEARHGELVELQAEVARSLASLGGALNRKLDAAAANPEAVQRAVEGALRKVHDAITASVNKAAAEQAERTASLREDVVAALADVDGVVAEALEAGVGSFEQRAIGLRSEVSSGLYELQQLILEASRADSQVVEGAFASASRRIDEAASAARAIAAEQVELRAVVEELLDRLGDR